MCAGEFPTSASRLRSGCDRAIRLDGVAVLIAALGPEDAHASVERISVVARDGKRVPDALEKEPVLRVGDDSLSRGETEEIGPRIP